MTRESVIERVKILKEINIYKKQGMSVRETSKIVNIEANEKWQMVYFAYKVINTNMAQIEIIDNLTQDEIKEAVLRYRNGSLINEIIIGINQPLAISYFIELHISESDKNYRKNLKSRTKYKNKLALNPKITIKDSKPIIEPTPEPVNELWDFSGENIIETKRPALVQFHGKSSGLGYGCAANMCAER